MIVKVNFIWNNPFTKICVTFSFSPSYSRYLLINARISLLRLNGNDIICIRTDQRPLKENQRKGVQINILRMNLVQIPIFFIKPGLLINSLNLYMFFLWLFWYFWCYVLTVNRISCSSLQFPQNEHCWVLDYWMTEKNMSNFYLSA